MLFCNLLLLSSDVVESEPFSSVGPIGEPCVSCDISFSERVNHRAPSTRFTWSNHEAVPETSTVMSDKSCVNFHLSAGSFLSFWLLSEHRMVLWSHLSLFSANTFRKHFLSLGLLIGISSNSSSSSACSVSRGFVLLLQGFPTTSKSFSRCNLAGPRVRDATPFPA